MLFCPSENEMLYWLVGIHSKKLKTIRRKANERVIINIYSENLKNILQALLYGLTGFYFCEIWNTFYYRMKDP